MCCDDSCSDNCRAVFCNITPFKNAAKDSLPCPDNTNKFILFWVKYISVRWQAHLRDPKPNRNPQKASFFNKTNSFKSPKNSKNRACLQRTLYQVVTNRPKSRFSATKKVGFLIKYKLELNKIVS